MLFVVALLATLVMGFANQRGGTCTVAAIEEILAERRFTRLAALLEASFWVAAGLVLLSAIHCLPPTPYGFSIGGTTIAGSVLFGIGAYINRACIFGTVARLGSGEWAYLATPIGFYLGALLGTHLRASTALGSTSLLLAAPIWLAVVAAAGISLRVFSHGTRIRRLPESRLAHIWSPHVATIAIGITFLAGFVSAGAWPYSELLIDVAHGGRHEMSRKAVLNIALLGGAVLGGWTAKRLRLSCQAPWPSPRPSWAALSWALAAH